jgi:Fe-S cluster assembly ATP-binding protein
MLKIENLSFIKNKTKIIQDLNIQFNPGTISAIIGANGAGKTTISKIIMGLTGYRKITGDIFFNGKSIKRLSVYQRSKTGITMSWQDPVRFEGISVRKYLTLSATNKNLDKIKESLLMVGLSPEVYIDRLVDSSLSGGERKRIELASVYLMNPKVIVLDEPDSGIDIDSLYYINNMIKCFKKNGSIVILITHNLKTMEKADIAFLLCKGKLLKVGSPNMIKKYFNKTCRDCKMNKKFDLNIN